MRSHDGSIDHHAFHVSVSCEVLEHGNPDSTFSPSIKSFVNTVPITVFFGEESPLSTTTGHPEDRVDESFAESSLTDVKVSSGLKVGKNFLPLLSVEFNVGHNLF